MPPFATSVWFASPLGAGDWEMSGAQCAGRGICLCAKRPKPSAGPLWTGGPPQPKRSATAALCATTADSESFGLLAAGLAARRCPPELKEVGVAGECAPDEAAAAFLPTGMLTWKPAPLQARKGAMQQSERELDVSDLLQDHFYLFFPFLFFLFSTP